MSEASNSHDSYISSLVEVLATCTVSSKEAMVWMLPVKCLDTSFYRMVFLYLTIFK